MGGAQDLHPLTIAIVEEWARAARFDPADVWRWLALEAPPPPEFVSYVMATFPQIRLRDLGLKEADRRVIDRHVNLATLERFRQERTSGRPIESVHPFAQALRKANVSIKEWATAHGLTRQRVNSWMLEGDGGRKISRRFAEELQRDLGVPLSAWKNGIRD